MYMCMCLHTYMYTHIHIYINIYNAYDIYHVPSAPTSHILVAPFMPHDPTLSFPTPFGQLTAVGR